MKNIRLYCLLCIIWSILGPERSFSQKNNFSLTIGSEKKDKITLEACIGYQNGSYLLYHKGVVKVRNTIEKTDENLNFIDTAEFPYLKKRVFFNSIQTKSGVYLLFHGVYQNSDDKTYCFYYKKIDADLFTVDAELHKFFETTDNLYTEVSLSPDKSKVMVYHVNRSKIRENFSLSIYVYDDEFNSIWNRQYELPFKSVRFKTEKIQVDNSGNAYLLGKSSSILSNGNLSSSFDNDNYYIVSCSKDIDSVKIISVDCGEKNIHSIKSGFDNEANFLAAGFYHTAGKKNVEGCFLVSVDNKTLQKKQNIMHNFSSELVKSFDHNVVNSKNILAGDDGCIYLIGEVFKVKTSGGGTVVQPSPGSGPGMTKTTSGSIQFFYKDILVQKFLKDGTPAWTKTIPKNQRDLKEEILYASFISMEYNNKLYFIYNDLPENFNSPEKIKTIKFQSNKPIAVAVSVIDSEGNLSKELLINRPKRSLIFNPNRSKIINDGVVLIYFSEISRSGNNKYSYAKLKIN